MTSVVEAQSAKVNAAKWFAPRRKAVASNSKHSSDRALRRSVLARLIAHPLVKTGHIGVDASAGGVTLSGYVTSNAQKDAAIAAARRVDGVDRVVDELRVALPCPDFANPADQAFDVLLSRQTTCSLAAFNRTPVTQSPIGHPGLQP